MPGHSYIARLNGLDTLRAFAIIIVLMFHYKAVVSGENTFGYLTNIGWMGVDLFFVLSGYLIGNQLLSAVANRQPFSLKLFYIRRLLRTLPNYYVVYALYFLFPTELIGNATEPVWRFLTFTQNFNFRPGDTFTHSWSLCIEEQFYFIFPLLFLGIAKVKKSVSLAWLALGAGMLLAIAARWNAWSTYGQEAINQRDYFQYIYYSSFTRFDELLPGVAIAMLKNFHPRFFDRLMIHSKALLILGLLITGILFYAFPHFHWLAGVGTTFFLTVFGYSLLAIGFALLVFSTLSDQSWLGRLKVPGAAQLALWSYAIYLIHKPLFKLLMQPLDEAGIDVKSVLGVAIIISVSIACGWLLFVSVETPFMKIRTRFFPSNMAR